MKLDDTELAVLREMLYGSLAKNISFPNIYAPVIVKLQKKVKKAIQEKEDGSTTNGT